MAASAGHVEVVRWLLELPARRGVKATARDNSAVRLAAQNGHLPVVRLLTEVPPHRGVDVAAGGDYSLHEFLVHASTGLGDFGLVASPAVMLATLRYLTLELPGGERSLDSGAVRARRCWPMLRVGGASGGDVARCCCCGACRTLAEPRA